MTYAQTGNMFGVCVRQRKSRIIIIRDPITGQIYDGTQIVNFVGPEKQNPRFRQPS